MKIPKYITEIFEILERYHIESYVVGGCVRDFFLGKVPEDYDMCASETPEKLFEILSKYFRVIPTGIQHGTLTILTERKNVEITSFRIETGYSDMRHPDTVIFTKNIEEDLARRDFTINSLCYNPKTGIIDLFGGVEDIKNKIIRTVGDSDRRFSEDALRMIRALRFASQLDFKIEKSTSISIRKNFSLIQNISWERILSETTKLLFGSCYVLDEYKTIFRKIYTNYPDNAFEKIKESKSVSLKYYFLLQNNDYKTLSEVTRQMKFSHKIRSDILFIKKYCNAKHTDIVDMKFIVSRFGIEKASLLFEFFDVEEDKNGYYIDVLNKIVSESSCLTLKNLAVNGNDLKNIGIEGKKIGNNLHMLLEMVIEEKIKNDKSELIDYIISKGVKTI